MSPYCTSTSPARSLYLIIGQTSVSSSLSVEISKCELCTRFWPLLLSSMGKKSARPKITIIRLGHCQGCDGQVFISYDCSEAFECRDALDYPLENDGCTYECGEEELVYPDFNSGSFECVDNSNGDLSCPGRFFMRCTSSHVHVCP